MTKDKDAESNNDTPKGFAGLASLVSSVDENVPDVPRENKGPKNEIPQKEAEHPTSRKVYQQPVKSKNSDSSFGKWGLSLMVIVVAVWGFNQINGKKPEERAPYLPLERSTSADYQPAPVVEPLSRPQESLPPAGYNLVLSTAQIRYCVAENIRIDGAKSAVNNYIDAEVYRFNAMVADYNSRCGNFRYQAGDLQTAERDMEPYRAELLSEGTIKFAPSKPIPSSENSDSGTLNAPFFADPLSPENLNSYPSSLNPPAYDPATQPLAAPSALAAPVSPPPQNAYDEQLAIHNACESSLRHSGQQNYEWCVERESADLKSSGGPPDMSGFTKLEKAIIENACSSERQYTGPSTYYDCLRKEVNNVNFN